MDWNDDGSFDTCEDNSLTQRDDVNVCKDIREFCCVVNVCAEATDNEFLQPCYVREVYARKKTSEICKNPDEVYLAQRNHAHVHHENPAGLIEQEQDKDHVHQRAWLGLWKVCFWLGGKVSSKVWRFGRTAGGKCNCIKYHCVFGNWHHIM